MLHFNFLLGYIVAICDYFLAAAGRWWNNYPEPLPERIPNEDGWIEDTPTLPKEWSLYAIKKELLHFFVTGPLNRHTKYPINLEAETPTIPWVERIHWTFAASIHHNFPQFGVFEYHEEESIPIEMWDYYIAARTSRIWAFEPYPTWVEMYCLQTGYYISQYERWRRYH
jgi:hypothetical protein